MNKIKILVIPSDNQGGVGFYRSTQPHKKLVEMYPDEFDVTFNYSPNFFELESFKQYDIIHIHKGLFANRPQFIKAMEFFKENSIVTIMDIDDNWRLGSHHPNHIGHEEFGCTKMIIENLKLFDYVTTTTEIFANKVKLFNKNVIVLPNAIDPEDENFQIIKVPNHGKLRIGMVLGSTHEYDVQVMGNFTNGLSQEILDKVQFVLCGFDTRGIIRYKRCINHKTIRKERPIKPKETVWYHYEQMMTDNYKIISPEYKQYLNKFDKNVSYPNEENEIYRRFWTKPINEYFQHYKYVDVLLAPLEENEFNLVKSQLKVIECAFSNTAIIASNFGPYTIDLVSVFEKGGAINPNGNAILIDKNRNHKDWKKSIEKLVKQPELVQMLRNNLKKSVSDKYNLLVVTDRRASFYREIVKT